MERARITKMKPLPLSPELLRIASRVVWFKEPEEALREPVHFLAHVMTYGSLEDLKEIDDIVRMEDYRETLDHAPPGVFDPRSWAYWNLICGRTPCPPLPVRKGVL
jgi:hypothetical protein